MSIYQLLYLSVIVDNIAELYSVQQMSIIMIYIHVIDDFKSIVNG